MNINYLLRIIESLRIKNSYFRSAVTILRQSCMCFDVTLQRCYVSYPKHLPFPSSNNPCYGLPAKPSAQIWSTIHAAVTFSLGSRTFLRLKTSNMEVSAAFTCTSSLILRSWKFIVQFDTMKGNGQNLNYESRARTNCQSKEKMSIL